MACFRNPAFGNTHNLTPPGDDRDVLWNACGLLHGTYICVAIGPRLACTAGHVALVPDSITPGTTFVNFNGTMCIILEVHNGVGAAIDAAYLVLDRDVPAGYVKRWNGEAFSINNNMHVVHGAAYGRGTEIYVDTTLVGWNVGGVETVARRWSQGKLARWDYTVPSGGGAYIFQDPTSEAAHSFIGDSGSACFMDAGTGTGFDKWLYMGPTSGTTSTTEARFDVSADGVSCQGVWVDYDFIDTLNGEVVTPKTIVINEPPDGFDMAGAQLPIIGVTTGDLPQITVSVNGALRIVTINDNAFFTIVDIPLLATPTQLTIQAFDGATFASSTIFSNIVHGEAVNLPPPVQQKTIGITDPANGFDMSGSIVPVSGHVTGALDIVTVRANGVMKRVQVVNGTFSTQITIPVSPEPTTLTIDSFDGTTFENSTVFSNVVTGRAVNLPPPAIPCPRPVPKPYAIECCLQSPVEVMPVARGPRRKPF